jgi:DNA-binding PucR family transcriptional regulator
VHRVANGLGVDVLAGVHGDQLVVVLGTSSRPEIGHSLAAARLLPCFGAGPVVIGPEAADIGTATSSARAALAGVRAAAAWPRIPRPADAAALLPERLLAGDRQARAELIDTVYLPLRDAGNDLLATAEAYLATGGSIEGAARDLFVHANTVRYRLRRVTDVTGVPVTEPRGRFILGIAIAAGRLADADEASSTPLSDGY